MKRLWLLLACGVLLPATARAEPIAIHVQSSSGGFSGATAVTGSHAIDLGTIGVPAGSVGTYLIQGLREGTNYAVSFVISGISGWDTLTAELLDPIGDGNDRTDPASQPSYVPAGYSTSNNTDGLSFAQDTALARSAIFAGGSAIVTADELTNARDVLTFASLGSGLTRVTFGLRNYGRNGFLLRLSANGNQAPEPASMFLLGTGLAGLAAYRRRRSMAS
jgi:PEP-CTERM motif